MAKIYLAGGMRSDWRKKVKSGLWGLNVSHEWIDPTERNNVDVSHSDEYAAWDVAGVQQADIVFAYMETDNPSGVGLALEVGVAIGMGGKLIIVVNEDCDNPYMRIVEDAPGVVPFVTLDLGIEFLRSVTW